MESNVKKMLDELIADIKSSQDWRVSENSIGKKEVSISLSPDTNDVFVQVRTWSRPFDYDELRQAVLDKTSAIKISSQEILLWQALNNIRD